jgi:hypothetical protein
VVTCLIRPDKRKIRNSKHHIILSIDSLEHERLDRNLSKNEQRLNELFNRCADFVVRTVHVTEHMEVSLCYVEGLCDTKKLDELFLMPLLFDGLPLGTEQNVSQFVRKKLIAVSSVKEADTFNELVNGLLKGSAGILVDGEATALLADLRGYNERSVEEPQSEVVIRGPRDGFTESLRTNISLLRRRIRSTKLKIESYSAGRLSKTDIAIAYIEGIAPDSLLEEIRTRVSRVQTDGILESEYIEEFIEDSPYSPFPQILNTERPDTVAANLLEGRAAIFVDNTPFVLIVPMTFWSGLQAAEDHYQRFLFSTLLRLLRYILFLTSLFLPSLYVALTTFHPKLIPNSLLVSIAAAREGVPFPALIEAAMMEFLFEGLREAGLRLPKPVGQAVSIVGALVIGQAAVQAGIISAPMVIVVATTGIASFAIPRYNLGTAVRMIRFVLLFLAGALGLYGVVIGFVATIIHLVNLRSFGVPYFTPVSPQIASDLKDLLIRAPRWFMTDRPVPAGRNDKRTPKGQDPIPEQEDNHE